MVKTTTVNTNVKLPFDELWEGAQKVPEFCRLGSNSRPVCRVYRAVLTCHLQNRKTGLEESCSLPHHTPASRLPGGKRMLLLSGKDPALGVINRSTVMELYPGGSSHLCRTSRHVGKKETRVPSFSENGRSPKNLQRGNENHEFYEKFSRRFGSRSMQGVVHCAHGRAGRQDGGKDRLSSNDRT